MATLLSAPAADLGFQSEPVTHPLCCHSSVRSGSDVHGCAVALGGMLTSRHTTSMRLGSPHQEGISTLY